MVPICVTDTAVIWYGICTLEILLLGTSDYSVLLPGLFTLQLILLGGIPHAIHRWPRNECPLHSMAHSSMEVQCPAREPSFLILLQGSSLQLAFHLEASCGESQSPVSVSLKLKKTQVKVPK